MYCVYQYRVSVLWTYIIVNLFNSRKCLPIFFFFFFSFLLSRMNIANLCNFNVKSLLGKHQMIQLTNIFLELNRNQSRAKLMQTSRSTFLKSHLFRKPFMNQTNAYIYIYISLLIVILSDSPFFRSSVLTVTWGYPRVTGWATSRAANRT